MTQSIVVGANDSGPGRAAVTWAARRADDLDAELVLLCVIDSDDDTEQSEQLLARFSAEIALTSPSLRVHRQTRVGHAMTQLIAASETALLTVVGTHKTGFLRGRSLGSTVLRLVRAAGSPVAVIPESSGRPRRGVVVGVDDSESGQVAVLFAAAEALRTHQPLVELRAWDGENSSGRAFADTRMHEDQESGLARAELSRAATLTAANSSELWMTSRLVKRTPAEALLDASMSAELLVIGAGDDHEKFGLGPVTHDVLLNLSGPTIIVRRAGSL